MNSSINWDFATHTTRGNNHRFQGKILFRDGSSGKTQKHSIGFYKGSPPEIRNSEKVIFGMSNQDEVYLSTKVMPTNNSFPTNRVSESTTYVNSKDLCEKIIKKLTGIDPEGNLDIGFNLQKVNGQVWKFTDVDLI